MVEDILFIGRPSTIRSQKSLFKNWIENCVKNQPLPLDETFLIKLVKVWESHDLKPGTIRLLCSIYKRYVYLTTGNQIKAPRLSRVLQSTNREHIKAWTKDQVKIALEVAKSKDTNLYSLILIGLHTGMRPGEIFALRGKDVDFLKHRISILNTKTGKPRTVKMTPEVETVLIGRIVPSKESERIFSGKIPNEELKELCRCARIPVLTFHGLRHTFATLALDSGWSPRNVAKVLGHNKVSTTLDYYWQSINDDLEVEFYE